ncbi:hypothetical protein ABBQ38_003784 [Trebouxia sp. C0009 RCD-2024]
MALTVASSRVGSWLFHPVLQAQCCCQQPCPLFRHAPGIQIGANREDGTAGLGRVVTDGTCPGLRRIHLSGLMLADHLTDSYFEALGSTNPTKQDAIGQET